MSQAGTKTRRPAMSVGSQLAGFAFLIERGWPVDLSELAMVLRKAKGEEIPKAVRDHIAALLDSFPPEAHPMKKSKRGRHIDGANSGDAVLRANALFHYRALKGRRRIGSVVDAVASRLEKQFNVGIGRDTIRAWISSDRKLSRTKSQERLDDFNAHWGKPKKPA
jgi:hypothetical protein